MAIITNNINSNPMTSGVLAISQDTPFVQLPDTGPEIDFCTCDFECEYINEVFASLSDNDEFKNDKTSFLIGLSDDSSVLEITLVGPNDETIINDDTLGQYFAKGSFTNTPNQANYIGFIADWKKILTVKGSGTYFFKFKETTFGEEFEKETVKYRLLPYNENLIFKTLRFKFIQNGIIQNGLDYTGLNWSTEVRIKASLKYQPSTLTQDNYLTGERVIEQIQDSLIRNFEIQTGLIPSKIGNLLEDGTLSNNILVSNYNWFAYQNDSKYIQDLSIIITEISNFVGDFKNNSLGSLTFTAQERKQNRVKRNV